MEQAVNNSTALVIRANIGDSFLLPLVTLLLLLTIYAQMNLLCPALLSPLI